MGTNTPSQEHELIRNWPILVVAFILVFLAFGIPTYSLPFMYGPAMKEFGWTNAEVNLLSTAKFVIGAVAALGMGILVDRIGGRLAVLIGAATGGLAMMSIGPFLIAVPLWVIFVAMSKKLGPVINAPTPLQNKLSTWEHFKLISQDRNFWLIAVGIFLVSAVDQAVQQNTVQFLIHN